MRLLTWIAWIAGMVFVVGGLHYYCWLRLARDTALPPPWRTVITATLIGLAISIPTAFFIGRVSGALWRDVFVWVAFAWMGTGMLMFVLLFGSDLIRWAAKGVWLLAGHGQAEHDPARRLFVSRLLAGGAAVGSLGLAALAVRSGAMPPVLRRVRVHLKRLPPELSGTTIVQITDLHVGQPIRRDYVADVVRRTNELAPDIVAITGDLVDGGTVHLRDDIAPISELTARHGVFFVTGNHEYYSGVEPWLRFLEEMGVRTLRNERVSIGNGKASFDLAGVDDSRAQGFAPGHGADVARAMQGYDPSREVVLLAHQPREIHAAAEHEVGLQISGHTHGGQIWPFNYFVGLAQPYVAGLATHGSTETQIYVSTGTGHWGPPMRLGVPAELTLIELVRADEPSMPASERSA